MMDRNKLLLMAQSSDRVTPAVAVQQLLVTEEPYGDLYNEVVDVAVQQMRRNLVRSIRGNTRTELIREASQLAAILASTTLPAELETQWTELLAVWNTAAQMMRQPKGEPDVTDVVQWNTGFLKTGPGTVVVAKSKWCFGGTVYKYGLSDEWNMVAIKNGAVMFQAYGSSDIDSLLTTAEFETAMNHPTGLTEDQLLFPVYLGD
jgi:hypothetical protein